MRWYYLPVLVALSGAHGPIWVETKQITSVMSLPHVGDRDTLIGLSGGQPVYVEETPEDVVRIMQDAVGKCGDKE